MRRRLKRLTDSEIFEAAVFSSGDFCGHGAQIHGLLDDIAVSGDSLWIYGLEKESVIVLSETVSQPRVSGSEMDVMTEYFLIWVMSLERTSLRGFSFKGRGGAFWPSSKATDFRFLDIFIAENRKERRRSSLWMGEWERMEQSVRSIARG